MAYSANYGGGGGGGGGGGYGGYSGEYSTTSYGAQGGNDGGGFMAGSQPAGSQGQQEKYGRDTLRPCTILQIHSAERTGMDFVIDGTEIGSVSIVGQVRAATKQAIGINYTLDDGTGSIDAREWIGGDTATHDEEGNPLDNQGGYGGGGSSGVTMLEVGQWAKVFGMPRQLGNQPRRNFNIKRIRPITDMNEINHHLLEATAIHLYYTKGPPGQASAKQEDDGGLFVKQSGGGAGGDGMAGLSANAKRMLLWMQKQDRNGEGYHMQHIAASTGIPTYDVIAAGDELSSAGKICATVDEQTWNIIDF